MMVWTHLLTCKLHTSATTCTSSQPCLPCGSQGTPAHTGIVSQRHHVTVWAHVFAYLPNPSYSLGQSGHTCLHVGHVEALPLGSLFACKAFSSSPMWQHGVTVHASAVSQHCCVLAWALLFGRLPRKCSYMVAWIHLFTSLPCALAVLC